MNPRTGRELTLNLPRPVATAAVRRVVVIGAGPAGLAAAADAGAAGHSVVVLERNDSIGGQVTIAGSSPGHAEQARALTANYTSLLTDAGVDLRLGVAAGAELVTALDPDLVILATGARPAPARQPLNGVPVLRAWDVLDGSERPAGRVIVSDWGGDSVALDCAEVLAANGCQVTLAVGAVTPGETVHQYARNQYLGRLARAGVEILDRHGLASAAGGDVEFANVFAPELRATLPADALVISHGRVPDDELYEPLVAAVGADRIIPAGDCCSPRGLEEAIFEGTLAVRRGLAVHSSR